MAGTVLVSDDDPQLRQFVLLALEDAGYRVLKGLGRAAPAPARVEQPDVILLDVPMLAMNGGELCRHPRADPATAAIPIVAMPARRTALDVPGRRSGAWPGTPSDLDRRRGVVARWVRR